MLGPIRRRTQRDQSIGFLRNTAFEDREGKNMDGPEYRRSKKKKNLDKLFSRVELLRNISLVFRRRRKCKKGKKEGRQDETGRMKKTSP